MLSASCFFRGNYMTPAAAERLLRNLCLVPELEPEFWGIYEGMENPFREGHLNEVIYGSMVPSGKGKERCVRSLAFFGRKSEPACLVSIDLRLAPVQWSTPHNSISIDDTGERWPGGEYTLAQYLPLSVLPDYPDYGRIVSSSQEDTERLKEFHRPLTPEEVVQSISQRTITAPFGPHGCLEDIYWFNYFGRVYVQLIGKARLQDAGWARVEEIGNGLACYATETIDDPNGQERRRRIANALEEFVWTPGCRADDKRVATFDFSEKLRESE